MSGPDVYLDDMGFFSDTAELDRVLTGEVLPDDAPLARFVEDMREAFPAAPVAAEVEMQHLMAMMAAASEISTAEVRLLPSRLDRLRSSLAARVGALTLAAGSGLTGAAYAGVLPDPVQGAVSEAAAQIGVDLPHPDDEFADQDVREATNERADDTTGGDDEAPPAPNTSGGSDGSTGDTEDGSSRSPRSRGAAGDDDHVQDEPDSDDDSDDGDGDEDEQEGQHSDDGSAPSVSDDRESDDSDRDDDEASGGADDAEDESDAFDPDPEIGDAEDAGEEDASGRDASEEADLNPDDYEVPSELDD